jgi:hypothetical protein
MEPQLRKLGLPTSLKNGVIELQAVVTVCREGDVLTPEQCKILQLFNQQIAQFKVKLHCMYEKSTGKLQQFEGAGPIPTGGASLDEDNEADMDEEPTEEKKRAPKKAASKKGKAATAAAAAPSVSATAPADFKFDFKNFAFSFAGDAAATTAATSTTSSKDTTSTPATTGSATSRVTRSRAKKA